MRPTTRTAERARIVESFQVFDLGETDRNLILEALDSKEWDWFIDCDGCTMVSEIYWPTKYFPPCLRHDFDWYTGRGGPQSNARFYHLMRAYGVVRARAALRWLGVTAAWYAWYRWRRR